MCTQQAVYAEANTNLSHVHPDVCVVDGADSGSASLAQAQYVGGGKREAGAGNCAQQLARLSIMHLESCATSAACGLLAQCAAAAALQCNRHSKQCRGNKS